MTVYFLSPEDEEPVAGGVQKMYRFAQVLLQREMPAAVVQDRPGFRPACAPPEVPVVHPPLKVSDEDVLAIPEVLGHGLAEIAPGIPRVSLNQNAYLTFIRVGWREQHPYLTTKSLLGVTAVSADNLAYLQYAFPDLYVRRIRYGLDPALIKPRTGRPRQQIAYMPRKRAEESTQVLGLLHAHGALHGWKVVPIEGASHRQALRVMRESALFLSFSYQEGWGLPPLEAAASGAFVIGYTGQAGAEFFDRAFSIAIPDGAILQFAQEIERFLKSPHTLDRQTSLDILHRFTPEQEAADVHEFFTEALERRPRPAGRRTTLEPLGRWYEPGRLLRVRRRARRLLRRR